ncbi:zinc-dependent metalloprotease [Actinomyces marmotae]|uniref:zinc-dependent metalloprotease n=1 Tax=Actinomyces marmotae TaxID=2737173 RepID=UPI001359D8A1|nr:zinc-dependent metalloprotease [Actinomyces marmotae]
MAPALGTRREEPGPVGAPSTARGLVDWSRVEIAARTMAPRGGPSAPRASLSAVVELLRCGAAQAPERVGEMTGLSRAARDAGSGRVLVVDRAGLVRATAGFLARLLDGLPAPPAGPVARRAAAWEAGAALGALSTRLLGQVLPAIPVAADAGGADGGRGTGSATGADGAGPVAEARTGGPGAERPRLLLVAPNVLALQRRHGLDLADLATWVAMHETAHAVQLAAAPWLADHLVARLREALGAVVEAWPRGGRLAGIASVAWAARPGEAAGLVGQPGLAGLVELRATLAFLEGHARAALDGVTPARVPSAHVLRAVLDADPAPAPGQGEERGIGQGHGRGPFAGLASERLLDSARAARFARAVVERAGHEGLNRAWASPWALPTAAELGSPEAWLERVGGGPH